MVKSFANEGSETSKELSLGMQAMSTNQNKGSMCCEQCIWCECSIPIHQIMHRCTNKNCPCHRTVQCNPPTEKGGEECCDIKTKGYHTGYHKSAEPHFFSMEETWEQRFDKIYSIFPAGHFSEQLIPNGDGEKKKPIKAFINQEVVAARIAERDLIRETLISKIGNQKSFILNDILEIFK